MSELRQNPLSGQWVVYSPSRKRRPYDFHGCEREASNLPERDMLCPFCPGNERMLPDIIMEEQDDNGVSWRTRVVSNKYAALEPAGPQSTSEIGPYGIAGGYGYHEVIIESPIHNEDMPQMTQERVEAIVETYHKRYIDILKDDRIKRVFIFRNHGKGTGTSLLHPHSQLIATPVIPASIERSRRNAQANTSVPIRGVFFATYCVLNKKPAHASSSRIAHFSHSFPIPQKYLSNCGFSRSCTSLISGS